MVCRDGLPFLEAALESVRAQTLEDWELVYRDNGSTDGSPREVERSVPPERRTLVGDGRPVPLGRARREAAGRARAPLVTFLDADDAWEPDKLERQVALLEGSGAALAYSDCRVVAADGTPLGRYSRRWPPASGRIYRRLLLENVIPLPTAMVRRAALEEAGGFDPALHWAQDYDVWLRVAREGEVAYDPAPTALYRVHASNLTHRFRGAYGENAGLYARLAREAEPSEREVLARAWALLHVRWAAREAAAGSPLAALRRLREAVGGPAGAGVGDVAAALGPLFRGIGLRLRMERARSGSGLVASSARR